MEGERRSQEHSLESKRNEKGETKHSTEKRTETKQDENEGKSHTF